MRFSCDGTVHFVKGLKVKETVNAVFLGEAFDQLFFVLEDASL